IRGYRALTREEVAATVRTFPTRTQRFRARVSYPDGREEIFDLAGDAVYVDAHILKWRPWVNLLGVHTLYELDRLTGRYDVLADERGKPRTVFALGRSKPFDLFDVVRRFGRLSALLDAEYGSATFVGARGVAAYEILVSTSGLLARPLGETRASPARHGFGRLAHRRSKLQFTSWTMSPSRPVLNVPSMLTSSGSIGLSPSKLSKLCVSSPKYQTLPSLAGVYQSSVASISWPSSKTWSRNTAQITPAISFVSFTTSTG